MKSHIAAVECEGAYPEIMPVEPMVNVTVSQRGVGCTLIDKNGLCDQKKVINLVEYNSGKRTEEYKRRVLKVAPRICIHLVHRNS